MKFKVEKRKTQAGNYSIYILAQIEPNLKIEEEFQVNFEKEAIANNLMSFLIDKKKGYLLNKDNQIKLHNHFKFKGTSKIRFYEIYKDDFEKAIGVKITSIDENFSELQDISSNQDKLLQDKIESLRHYYKGTITSLKDLETVKKDGFNCIDGNLILLGEFNNKNSKKNLENLGIREVTGNFVINNGNLRYLKGCPEIIGANFICKKHKLFSLTGGPRSVGGLYDCSVNPILSLKGFPEKLNGNFIFNKVYTENEKEVYIKKFGGTELKEYTLRKAKNLKEFL